MKRPRVNCEYDTATQPAANRSEQQEVTSPVVEDL
jgi:hypothetical protein